MNIVVCVKQIPDVDDIKWTKENNLDRSQMLSKINPYDEYALNFALKIKSKFKTANICTISMGPNQAKEVLEYSIAKGANRAILLSDKLFSGSDTLITAKILSKAIKKYIPDFNIILTGQAAQDGDTEQVPVSLAQMLSIPDVTNVEEVINADKSLAIVLQRLNKQVNMYEIQTPCLISVKKDCKESYIPKIEDYVKAQNTLIETYNAQNLEFSSEEIGIKGSPTVVYKAYRPNANKKAQEIKEDYTKKILELILKAR